MNPFVLKADEEATDVLKDCNDLATSMLIGQVRSTAVELLRVSDVDPNEARITLKVAVGDTSGRPERPGAL